MTRNSLERQNRALLRAVVRLTEKEDQQDKRIDDLLRSNNEKLMENRQLKARIRELEMQEDE